MKTIHRSILFALITAGAAFTAAPALAQHKDDGHAPPHAHGPAAKAPETYAAAIKEIRERLAEVGEAVGKGDMDAAHDEADAAGSIARNLGALALKPGSGVAKEQVKQINLAGKALAEAGDRLHNAGEKKDSAGVTAAYKEMQKQFDSLDAAAPSVYFCPMHCEGAKTYDKPGTCPVCNMNLKKQTSDKFSVDIKPIGGKIEAGKPANFLFTLKDPTGLAVKTVEIVHEMPLHLLMVSKDLSWYAHEHPVLQPDGTFTFTWTFPAGGEYTLFNDFTPKDVGMQVVPVTLKVEGTPRAAVALAVDNDKPKIVDGYTVTLDTGGPVKTGGATHMAYTISKDGKPVTTLAPYLGAMGHLVIISEDRTQFVHSHPHESGAGHAGAAKSAMGGPKVDFEASFTVPGTYKGWAQFNVGTTAKEKVITVPFTFIVAKGEGKGAAPDGHKHGAMPVNSVCPLTREVADAAFTRDFKGQLVGFHDAASAATWDGLKDEERLSKFVAALAAGAGGAHDDAMPEGVDAAEARALYLTPGGKYTAADIVANGSVIASDKYKGKMSKHDFKPKPGDAICPITLTKVNPKFTWVIGGKDYQFCCPPCIDEFVLLAKESPDEIKDPSFYVKK